MCGLVHRHLAAAANETLKPGDKASAHSHLHSSHMTVVVMYNICTVFVIEWGYLYNKTLFGTQCIVFRLGIIGVMKRI